jgi:hypothetical protein
VILIKSFTFISSRTLSAAQTRVGRACLFWIAVLSSARRRRYVAKITHEFKALFFIPKYAGQWKLEQINLHPDMKLTSHGRFTNGGFVASMEVHADLAVGTLKQVIQFSDNVSPACLSSSDVHDAISSSFSGWDSESKSVAHFNATVDGIDGEVFKVPKEKKSVKFIEGEWITFLCNL